MRYKNCLIFIIIFTSLNLLTGCATTRSISLGEAEADGALTGSISSAICQAATTEHEEKGQWPDALRLARLGGLSTHNRIYDQDYAVYILDKPYHQIPEQMDNSQTFAFYGYYSETDSSYYSYCRIYYQYGAGNLTISSSTSGAQKGAAIHGMKLEAEKMLTNFFEEASEASCASELDKIVTEHALKISETSPNPTAKQILFEFSYALLAKYYSEVINFALEGPEFANEFDKYSLRLGKYIYRQDWTQF